MLIRSIAAELRQRNVESVLDCAVGTGFPALDLARAPSLDGVQIHCTDADLEMLSILEERAKLKNFDINRLAPPMGSTEHAGVADELVLTWSDLYKIHRTYDYVMCRGNSLTYAGSWTGGRDVASIDLITGYLEEMASKVRAGGHLHVDAPWELDLPQENYRSTDDCSIWEQVTREADHRHWRVVFKQSDRPRLTFDRFSTLLTIHDVKEILDKLHFELTEPFNLAGERPGFGVIIARKPD